MFRNQVRFKPINEETKEERGEGVTLFNTKEGGEGVAEQTIKSNPNIDVFVHGDYCIHHPAVKAKAPEAVPHNITSDRVIGFPKVNKCSIDWFGGCLVFIIQSVKDESIVISTPAVTESRLPNRPETTVLSPIIHPLKDDKGI